MSSYYKVIWALIILRPIVLAGAISVPTRTNATRTIVYEKYRNGLKSKRISTSNRKRNTYSSASSNHISNSNTNTISEGYNNYIMVVIGPDNWNNDSTRNRVWNAKIRMAFCTYRPSGLKWFSE